MSSMSKQALKSEILPLSELARRTEVMADIKKEVAYDKSTGTWSWMDRYCRDIPGSEEHGHGGFATWWDAVRDATEPYFDESE